MPPLVLDARDLNVLRLAQFAPHLIEQDFIFTYLNRISTDSHRREHEEGITISQRGSNPEVNRILNNCLIDHFTNGNENESLQEITQCINQSNVTLWNNQSRERIRDQICWNPRLSPRTSVDLQLAEDHPAREDCSVTASQRTALQLAVPESFHFEVLEEPQKQALIRAVQNLQSEHERAIRAEAPYQDPYHLQENQDERDIRHNNAQIFRQQSSEILRSFENNNDLHFFIEQNIQFFASRIENGLSYSPATPVSQPPVSLSFEQTQARHFTLGTGLPRLTLEANSNTLQAQIAGLIPHGQGSQQAYLWYDVGVSSNSPGRYNGGFQTSVYWNRFADNWFLSGGPYLSIRLPNSSGEGLSNIRLSILAGTFLSHSEGKAGEFSGGLGVELYRNSYSTRCSPLTPAILYGLWDVTGWMDHISKCVNDDSYHPTFPTDTAVGGVRFFISPSSGNTEVFAYASVGGIMQALGVRRPTTAFGSAADAILAFFGVVLQPRN